MYVCYGGMKKNKHIFISRDLSLQSIFRKRLLAAGCSVEGQSLVRFEGRAFASFPKTDWIFFYSSKAAAYFLNGLELLEQEWPAAVKIAAIGKGTAQWLKEKGLPVHFTGTGHPEETCTKFLARAEKLSVLFPQATHSKRSIERLAGEAIRPERLIVYDNSIRRDFDLIPPDILTFTSPLNVQAYFEKYPGFAAQPIIAIGRTTRQALEAQQQTVTLEAQKPSEEALAQAVLKCLA